MTSNQPIFLIVTPSYNQAQFLSQSVQSVLSQKNVELQYAVFDGGSDDGSVDILKKLGKKLFWISEKDKGQADAINKGISYFNEMIKKQKLNRSHIIFAYLNSDDFYKDDQVFEQVWDQFKKYPEKMWLVGDAEIVNESGEIIQQFVRKYKKVMRNVFGVQILSILNPVPQPSTFIRWQAVEEIGTVNSSLRFTMDYEYWLRLLQKYGEPILFNKTLSCFRIHKSSKGGIQFEKQFAEELQVARASHLTSFQIALHRIHSFLIVTAYKLMK